MKCMYAQTRPRFILSSEGVFGGMEFEPMLTPREKSPVSKISPVEDRTRDAVDSEPKHYQLSYSGPLVMRVMVGSTLLFIVSLSVWDQPSRYPLLLYLDIKTARCHDLPFSSVDGQVTKEVRFYMCDCLPTLQVSGIMQTRCFKASIHPSRT